MWTHRWVALHVLGGRFSSVITMTVFPTPITFGSCLEGLHKSSNNGMTTATSWSRSTCAGDGVAAWA